MPIEKLPHWPERPTIPPEMVNQYMLWHKLNEVIEAVNELRQKSWPKIVHPGSYTAQSPIVGRSDGSIWRLNPDGTEIQIRPPLSGNSGKLASEREETLGEAISAYAKIIRNHERRKVDGLAPYPKGVAEAREAIISAAQREYSQKVELDKWQECKISHD